MRNLRTNYAVSIKTQAILSYPEKNLTKQLGVGNTRSEPTDYETEFREIADARQESGQGLSGPGGLALERRAGGLQREPTSMTETQIKMATSRMKTLVKQRKG